MSTALELLADAVLSGRCLLLVLSQPRDGRTLPYHKVTLRPVRLRGRDLYQATFHFPQKVTHENLEPADAVARVRQWLPAAFLQGRLFTADADHTFHAGGGTVRVRTGPPTRRPAGTAHNREKTYPIPEGKPCPFLVETGVMTPSGQVKAPKYHKFRQINHFLELVADVLPALPRDREVRVVDFGCGKSYLTFALHHLLTAEHGRGVRILGLDRKADVIRDCAALAGRLGCTGLEFRVGDIETCAVTGPVDLAVSLHACDTATDAALARAVGWGCAAILAVPCCQHELAPQLTNTALSPILKHGILRDRLAAVATDALRAALLELHGYAAQVVEFIDLEHTAKNLLIRAVRHSPAGPPTAGQRDRYEELKRLLGVERFALERLLNPIENIL